MTGTGREKNQSQNKRKSEKMTCAERRRDTAAEFAGLQFPWRDSCARTPGFYGTCRHHPCGNPTSTRF